MSLCLTLVHFNDVYEIAPVSGGARGGLARVAGLRRQLLATNPHTLLTFAGDLCSPSALTDVIVDGAPLGARHGIAVMNRLGLDLMTYGDHEFHAVDEQGFLSQWAARHFTLISSNVRGTSGEPYPDVPTWHVYTLESHDLAPRRVGFLGLTKPVRLPKFAIQQEDCLAAAQVQLEQLAGQVDFIIALTHQPLDADRALLAACPGIDLILGGDDHHWICEQHDGRFIVKADANARSVGLVEVQFAETVSVQVKHLPVTPALAEEPSTQAEIDAWLARAFAVFREQGWEPTEIIATANEDLDGLESSLRCGSTTLSDIITTTMQQVVEADCALLCSWWLRLDDQIPAGGKITRYDLRRLFAYGDSPVYRVTLRGDFIADILAFSDAHRGSGSYILHSPNMSYQDGTGWIAGEYLQAHKDYTVALADDLLRDYLFHIDPQRASAVQAQGQHPNLLQAVAQALAGDGERASGLR